MLALLLKFTFHFYIPLFYFLFLRKVTVMYSVCVNTADYIVTHKITLSLSQTKCVKNIKLSSYLNDGTTIEIVAMKFVDKFAQL